MESKDKHFREVPGGKYDENGFYFTPNGSFWDPDGVYFNCNGFDSHGGYYDENLEYHPGSGWIEELMCYEDEKEDIISSKKKDVIDDEEEDDGNEELDELYDNVDYDKLLKDMEKKYSTSETTPVPFKPKETKVENITEQMLFNKIPESKVQTENIVRKEKVVEVNSLFN